MSLLTLLTAGLFSSKILSSGWVTTAYSVSESLNSLLVEDFVAILAEHYRDSSLAVRKLMVREAAVVRVGLPWLNN